MLFKNKVQVISGEMKSITVTTEKRSSLMWVEEIFFWKTQAERKNRINRQKREGCRSETWREEK
jgi:hypothetical protein